MMKDPDQLQMKVLHLIYTNGIAGAEKYLFHLLPLLNSRHNLDCHLMMVCSPASAEVLQDYCKKMQQAGVSATLIVTPRTGFYKAARSISNYIDKHQIKVIHSHLLNSDVIATLVKVIFNKQVIIISTKHGYKETILKQIPESSVSSLRKKASREFYYWLTKYIVKKTTFNYAVSQAIADFYLDLGLSNYRMPFIHHGVTVNDITEEAGVNYRISDPQIIIVGRLEEFKGHRYLISAMKLVINQYPESRLIVIGEGSAKETLQLQAEELGIKNNVIFKGFLANPYAYVKNSDVIVLPSLFEPFGLVYIEAFALRVPVVAFDTPAGNEIMVNNNTALLAPARDHEKLAEKILLLLADPLKAKAIAENAFKAYTDKFTTERMVDETAAYYRNNLTGII